ncbi:MAG: transporter [Sphingomonas bacterium]|nr:transporter [Sphingomonas bacterium]
MTARRTIAFPALAALLLAGCASTGNIQPQVAQVAPASLGLDADTATIDGAWWHAFGDPQLDTLIAAGFAGNPSLAGALARVRLAQSQVDVQHAGELPQVTALGTVQELRFSDHFIGPGGTSALGLVQGTLNWNVDLFGRQRAMVDQARSSAQAAALDEAAARLMLSTSIASTYVGLAQANRQIAVADGFVTTRQQAIGYVQSRIRNQLSSRFDEETAKTLLAEAQQARVRAERQRDLLVHALAALVGRGADFYPQIAAPTLALDSRPRVPDLIPADLLGRRPDLLAGQARIDATVAGRKVARAAFLPNVNITALASLASIGLGSFFTSGAAQFGGGPAISLPIFEGGKLRAQYKGATADLDGAVADYDNAVLGAVRESADALTQVRSTDADLAQQQAVVAGLRNTVRLDRVRVSTGLGSQLDSIDSGFRLLEAEQALVGLQADALTRRIQLIAALGGGFEPTAPLVAAAQADTRS